MPGRGYSLVAVKVQKKANGRVKRFRMRLGSATRLMWIWPIVVSAVVSVGLLACETAEPTPIEPTRLPSATAAPVVRVEPTLVVVPDACAGADRHSVADCDSDYYAVADRDPVANCDYDCYSDGWADDGAGADGNASAFPDGGDESDSYVCGDGDAPC